MLEEVLIPMIVIGGPLVLAAYWFRLRHLGRESMIGLARHAIDAGTPLDEKFLSALATPTPPPADRDLRRGTIAIAIALAVAFSAWLAGERGMLGVASFPLFVGIAYILLWARARASEQNAAPATTN